MTDDANGGAADDPKPNFPQNAQSVLGFLLAGAAGVLGFLGLRSDEVTTILRNDTRQATLIALILLLSVLAAAIGVAIPAKHKVSPLFTAGAFLALLAVGAFVIYKLPVQANTTPESSKESLTDSISLGAAGVVVLLASFFIFKKRVISTQFAAIMASIVLLATSLYGGMRLEADSQLNSAVQISASVAKSGADSTLSIHVTASRIREVGYIGINVMGLPSGVPFAEMCGSVYVPAHDAACTEDPCHYLVTECVVIMGATIPPDPDGDVDDTLSDALIPGAFQDITVKASVCQTQEGCGNLGSNASRVDLHLSNLPPDT
jgi:hypothetical protein